ncbi:hypothetical protein MCOR25_005673 [Pyricularia grisea]|uniref:Cation efflux protein transmembrane domain-containing protein n=1 Tax=Pyricularia grisea TaxID=148305 RepID=A0A6P8B8P6_PYRGI|nr:uncharacterized protein PgNI_03076 [Pyricularia grisea]KAI6364335.1 hypothetical protein MCOR25_005673 [Pyricularia grisea]TLD12215.1 hypothetical protein PgNI_03076 [Pyricularia grisea]
MVGKRGIFNSQAQPLLKAQKHGDTNIQSHGTPRQRRVERDLENGNEYYSYNNSPLARRRPNIWRFQDAAQTVIDDNRRAQLQKELLHGIDRMAFEKSRKSQEEISQIKNKGVRAYYEEQNERINDWLEIDAVVMAIADDVLESMDPDPDRDGHMERQGGLHNVHGRINELLPLEVQQKRAKEKKKATWAININVLANILLVFAKIVAVFTTGSLSLLASLVDSVLDLLCTVIIWTTTKVVGWRLDSLQKRFPVGRRRLEPLGIVVFSIIMVLSFMQILKESVEKLLPLEGHVEDLGSTAVGSMLATIILKGLIGLGCLPIKTTQVQALVQDCKTDVIFNTISLLFPFIGAKAHIWWLDPAGAAILSLYIIYDWGKTCFENIIRLSGEIADRHTYQKLMYMAYRFSPVVIGVKNIVAYHCGDGVWAEFDLLLDENTSLRRSHDIAETLQYCAEGLEEIDRCFVTTDYSSSGPAGHGHAIESS